jgi:hypothetical protein
MIKPIKLTIISEKMMDDAENDIPPSEDVVMEGEENNENRPPPRLMITKMVSRL